MAHQFVNVISFSEYIEEEVSLSNGNCEITCFASNPPLMRVGDRFEVDLYLTLLFNQGLVEIDEYSAEEIIRDENRYSYKIVGTLHGNILSSLGYDFNIGSLESEYAYLSGGKVSLKVDRIGVDFLDA